jgi:hypothetical protein
VLELNNQLLAASKFLNRFLRNVRGQKLLIIGAGCSKNYSQGSSQIQGLASPLDNDFFRMAKKVLLSGKVESDFLLRIQNLILSLQSQ